MLPLSTNIWTKKNLPLNQKQVNLRKTILSRKVPARNNLSHQLPDHLGALYSGEALVEAQKAIGEPLVIDAHLL